MLDKNEWIRPWAGSDDEVTKMLDIKLIRENPDKIKAGLKAKEVDCDELIDRILELDEQRRTLLQQTEALKAEQNKVSKQIPALKKAGEDTTAIFKEMGEIKGKISALDGQLRDVVNEYQQDLYCLPNMPDDDLLPGGKENNEPLRYFGEPKKFDFEPKNHVDLCTNLGLIDYERGVKLAGNGFWIYKGMGARLEWALLNYFIDTHLADGYEMIMPPYMLEYQCGLTAGQFPKFAGISGSCNTMFNMLCSSVFSILFQIKILYSCIFPKSQSDIFQQIYSPVPGLQSHRWPVTHYVPSHILQLFSYPGQPSSIL